MECTRPNEVWDPNPPGCLRERCEEMNTKCDFPILQSPKCVCIPGYFRNENDICVPASECRKLFYLLLSVFKYTTGNIICQASFKGSVPQRSESFCQASLFNRPSVTHFLLTLVSATVRRILNFDVSLLNLVMPSPFAALSV